VIELLAAAAIKTVLLVAIGFAAARVLRRAAAALRHLVWALTLGAALALPLATPWLPSWSVPVLAPRATAPIRPSAPVRSPAADGPVRVRAIARPEPAVLAADARASETSVSRAPLRGAWRGIVVAVWIGGVLVVLVSLGCALHRLWRLERSAGFIDDPSWHALARAVAREFGLRRPVRLRWSASGGPPMTWGAWRPIVLLPAGAASWPDGLRRDVLRHELAHVGRWDFVTQLVVRLTCAVYWFLPPVWLAARALRLERERACDDRVLRAGRRASTYAEHLLALSRALAARPRASFAAVAMARPSQLAERLVAVLDPRAIRTGTTRRHAVFAGGVAALVWLPLAAAAPGHRRAAPASGMSDVSSPAVTARAPLGAPPVPAAPTPQPVVLARAGGPAFTDTLDCRGEPQRSSSRSSSRSGRDDIEISVHVGRCTLSLDADGKFQFNDDFTDIQAVARGAMVRVETYDGAETRRLTLRGGDGRIDRHYTVDGAERPFDAAARQWLADALKQLLRSTGYAADDRARSIARRQGVAGLLAEIDSLRGSYTVRRYVTAGLELESVDVAAKQRLIERGAAGIDSDYEMAELLIAAEAIRPRSRELWSTIAGAAARINSSYERRRVLAGALKDETVDGRVAQDVMDAAQGIDSDYELAELLLQLQRAHPIDEALRAGFARAVATIQSDYERRRVLNAAVVPAALESVVSTALELAGTLDSDYELAELLIAAAPHVGGTSVAPFFQAVGGFRSDYERRRALTALLQRDDLDAAVLGSVLRASQAMSSDYDRAELLLAVARGRRIAGPLRDLYLAAVDGLRSQYDQDRALAGLARGERQPR
jgi:beta-lactamase regulating signal transducer with metallopeptidase domain